MAKKKKTRAKRRVMGILGKGGVVVMAIPPLVGSAANAAQTAIDRPDIRMAGRFNIAFSSFINGLARGYGIKEPFGVITVKTELGAPVSVNVVAGNIPKGVWITTTLIGGLMVAQDRVLAFVLKRPVKVPGTNIVLTGN